MVNAVGGVRVHGGVFYGDPSQGEGGVIGSTFDPPWFNVSAPRTCLRAASSGSVEWGIRLVP